MRLFLCTDVSCNCLTLNVHSMRIQQQRSISIYFWSYDNLYIDMTPLEQRCKSYFCWMTEQKHMELAEITIGGTGSHTNAPLQI